MTKAIFVIVLLVFARGYVLAQEAQKKPVLQEAEIEFEMDMATWKAFEKGTNSEGLKMETRVSVSIDGDSSKNYMARLKVKKKAVPIDYFSLDTLRNIFGIVLAVITYGISRFVVKVESLRLISRVLVRTSFVMTGCALGMGIFNIFTDLIPGLISSSAYFSINLACTVAIFSLSQLELTGIQKEFKIDYDNDGGN